MTKVPLGRLVRIDNLRGPWPSESGDFTPWLAQEENLAILSETLGLELELEAQEKAVGDFRADILCKDAGSNAWVLIENQLEKTDHKHLGQLLTYASGLEAVTIIWIAAKFDEQHRSTLDWLNRITDEDFRFFGIEIELWQIGDSPMAPKFNVVSKPNNWSNEVHKTVRNIDEGNLSERRLLQRDYWKGVHAALDRIGGPVSGNRTPQPQSWMSYSIGRSEFGLGGDVLRRRRQIRVNFYTDGAHAEAYFRALEADRAEIESELGATLTWEPLPNRRACRIAHYLGNVDPEDRADWPRQHEWMAKWLNSFHRVFASRVKELDLDDWRNDPEDEGADAATAGTDMP
ncbi:MAG: DUF4268 domain-containing protein [Pseudomonadota bacterium]|nr:DUF4268 domain-containing protein [Pseudomonadota bacterium]